MIEISENIDLKLLNQNKRPNDLLIQSQIIEGNSVEIQTNDKRVINIKCFI